MNAKIERVENGYIVTVGIPDKQYVFKTLQEAFTEIAAWMTGMHVNAPNVTIVDKTGKII